MTSGQCKTLAKQLVRWLLRTQAELCCHLWGLHTSSVLTSAHLGTCTALQAAEARCIVGSSTEVSPLHFPLLQQGNCWFTHWCIGEKERQSPYTTPLTLLLLKGLLLWSWLLLFFSALTTLLVSQHLLSPTNAIPIQWAACRKKEAYA